ncbi:3-oxoadipyl-CoA thiolase [Candidatus Kapabacteria bacterium]|nr:3-oxoadipyl-CoA thiolase [Candidatus Kapabacteria bacterium]
MSNSYLIDGIRTPIGKFGGGLATVRPDDMAALVIKELINRNPSIDVNKIEDVILGNANGAGEENRNVARMSALLAGLPVSVPGETINRLCSSGACAVANASKSIKVGEGDLFIAGGVESMSRAPYVVSKSGTAWARNAEMFDTSIGWRFVNPKLDSKYGTDAMGQTAENVAEQFGISREDQDQFAAWSQSKATAAKNNGRLAKEILAISIPQRKKDDLIINEDEFIREGTTAEILSKLRPAFRKEGSVTAGNASGVNDGAAALLLAGESAVKDYSLTPKAKVLSSAAAGVEPRIMGVGPIEAANKALSRAGLSFNDLDIIELNEAFSAQALACTRSWRLDDRDSRINPNGGAIAIGHPLGMTGARLTLTAMHELIEKDKQFALITMCVGVGQGFALVIERV